jgi:YHS domain-containing protein
MIGWVLKFILLMVVIRLIWRFLSGIIDGLSPERSRSAGSARGGAKVASVPLVRDPVCGTYVPRASAKVIGTGDATLYFCSDKCRDEYGKGRAASR